MTERGTLGCRKYLPRFLQRSKGSQIPQENKNYTTSNPALMGAKILTGMTAWSFAAFSFEYKAHHIELLSSYGKDFIGPTIFYSFAQALTIASPRFERFGKPRATLAVYWIYALGSEFIQYQTQNSVDPLGGRYDPYDILALGLGTAFAIGINKYLNRRFQQKN